MFDLAERRTYLGASEAAAACGLSKYKSPLQLWSEKTGRIQPENLDDKIVVQVGNHLEPLVLSAFEKASGFQVVDRQQRVISETRPWMVAHIDGRVDGERLVEAKTSARRDQWGETGSDQVPAEYLLQVHHQMIAARAKVAYIPVIFSGSEFDWFEVPFDPELADMILEREAVFWDLVQRDQAPAATSGEDIKLLFPKDNGAAVTATQELVEQIDKMRLLRAQIKAYEVEADAIAEAVKLAMGPAAELVDPALGKAIVTHKAAKDSRVTDWQALAATLSPTPELIAQFTTTRAGSRRLLIK